MVSRVCVKKFRVSVFLYGSCLFGSRGLYEIQRAFVSACRRVYFTRAFGLVHKSLFEFYGLKFKPYTRASL